MSKFSWGQWHAPRLRNHPRPAHQRQKARACHYGGLGRAEATRSYRALHHELVPVWRELEQCVEPRRRAAAHRIFLQLQKFSPRDSFSPRIPFFLIAASVSTNSVIGLEV